MCLCSFWRWNFLDTKPILRAEGKKDRHGRNRNFSGNREHIGLLVAAFPAFWRNFLSVPRDHERGADASVARSSNSFSQGATWYSMNPRAFCHPVVPSVARSRRARLVTVNFHRDGDVARFTVSLLNSSSSFLPWNCSAGRTLFISVFG